MKHQPDAKAVIKTSIPTYIAITIVGTIVLWFLTSKLLLAFIMSALCVSASVVIMHRAIQNGDIEYEVDEEE